MHSSDLLRRVYVRGGRLISVGRRRRRRVEEGSESPPLVSRAAVRGGHEQRRNDCLLESGQKGPGSAGQDECEEAGPVNASAPPATSRSSAVKCRAAGRLDGVIFAGPRWQECFHELISSRNHNDVGGGNDLNRSLEPTPSGTHYDRRPPVRK